MKKIVIALLAATAMTACRDDDELIPLGAHEQGVMSQDAVNEARSLDEDEPKVPAIKMQSPVGNAEVLSENGNVSVRQEGSNMGSDPAGGMMHYKDKADAVTQSMRDQADASARYADQ